MLFDTNSNHFKLKPNYIGWSIKQKNEEVNVLVCYLATTFFSCLIYTCVFAWPELNRVSRRKPKPKLQLLYITTVANFVFIRLPFGVLFYFIVFFLFLLCKINEFKITNNQKLWQRIEKKTTDWQWIENRTKNPPTPMTAISRDTLLIFAIQI